MSHHVGVGQIVDADYFKLIASLAHRSEDQATDTSEPVNSNFDTHFLCS
jgi:hypothetical protein